MADGAMAVVRGVGSFSWRVKGALVLYVAATLAGVIAVAHGFVSEIATLAERGVFEAPMTPTAPSVAPSLPPPVPTYPSTTPPTPIPTVAPATPAPVTGVVAAAIARLPAYRISAASMGTGEYVGSFTAASGDALYNVSIYDFSLLPSDEGYASAIDAHAAVSVSAIGDAGGDVEEARHLASRILAARPRSAHALTAALGGMHVTDPPMDDTIDPEMPQGLRFYGLGAERGTTSVSVLYYEWSHTGSGTASAAARDGDVVRVVDAMTWSGATGAGAARVLDAMTD